MPSNEENTQTGRIPFFRFAPTNVRDILQRQIEKTVSRDIDAIQSFSIGNLDGRFIANAGAITTQTQNSSGQFYFIVGASHVGDGTVAGP